MQRILEYGFKGFESFCGGCQAKLTWEIQWQQHWIKEWKKKEEEEKDEEEEEEKKKKNTVV
jgi:hypothetical protein